MKKRVVIFWVCMATICLSLFLYGWSQDDRKVVKEFQQYSIEIIQDIPYVDEREIIENLLNQKGLVGWRFVSFTKEQTWTGNRIFRLIFERTIKLMKIEDKNE